MTTYGEPRVWLDQFPLGEPQPFEVDYHGIRYTGEIIRCDSWDPVWGQPLTGNTCFRIVLLLRQVSAPSIGDSRVAVCLPGAGEYRQRDKLLDEVATIRETQALYLTQGDPEADLIRRTLQRQQQGLEDQLMSQELSRYASGTVLSGPDGRLLPSDLFAGTDPVVWFSNLARGLLAQAYPTLPINAEVLPGVVTAVDPGKLFSAIFHPSDDTEGILAKLGPGLGLSSIDHAEAYDPSMAAALDIIGQKLSEVSLPASWPEVHHYLSHQVGLTGPLATLYLLVFLDQRKPELEIRLAPGHQLLLIDGRPLPGSRLTRDLLPTLPWDDRLADWATVICPATGPAWNDALPYLSCLSLGLNPVAEGEPVATQEQQLLRDLVQLSQQVRQSRDFLELLVRRGGTETESSERLSQVLGRLSRASGNDFQSVYQSARDVYPNHLLLEQDVKHLEQLYQLAAASHRISSVWDYLDSAVTPTNINDLSIEKQALAAALDPDSLLRFSRNWSGLAQQVAHFQTRFAAAYRAHHDRVHQGLAVYQRDLDSARLKLSALGLLNTIPELGQPVGERVSETLDTLDVALAGCPVTIDDLDLSQTPACHSCGLTLEQALPVEALAGLLATVDTMLGEKNRRLSNLLVEKILRGQMDQRLEDFLKIVQASDLSALSNTISGELVGFIRSMLV